MEIYIVQYNRCMRFAYVGVDYKSVYEENWESNKTYYNSYENAKMAIDRMSAIDNSPARSFYFVRDKKYPVVTYYRIVKLTSSCPGTYFGSIILYNEVKEDGSLDEMDHAISNKRFYTSVADSKEGRRQYVQNDVTFFEKNMKRAGKCRPKKYKALMLHCVETTVVSEYPEPTTKDGILVKLLKFLKLI